MKEHTNKCDSCYSEGSPTHARIFFRKIMGNGCIFVKNVGKDTKMDKINQISYGKEGKSV